LTPAFAWLTVRFFLINAFAAHVLEVMHGGQHAGRRWGTIKIVSRIERPASLLDKEAASGVAQRLEPEKM
jgi:hypothetical protein